VEGVNSPSDARLTCTFLSGFTGSAHCTVQYGADPTYMNLPYSAESTETGTAGDTVSVVLREQLNSSTEYYYTLSAVSGDMTMRVQGTFITPQYSKYKHVNIHILYHTMYRVEHTCLCPGTFNTCNYMLTTAMNESQSKT